MKKTIAFTGGGTAGHIMPNLALIERLSGEFNCIYVGTGGMESELCARRGITFLTVPAVKLDRSAIIKNMAIPFKLRRCVLAAKRALDGRADLVFSKGGYAALPAVLAAKKLRIPVMCHESDMSPGLTTKISARRGATVLTSFPACAQKIKNGIYVGTPLSLAVSAVERTGGRTKPNLLVVGGSSGAAAINKAVTAALPALLEKFNVIHITGKNKDGAPPSPGYRRIEYAFDMPALYRETDVAITRAGANALAELIYLKIPTVAIPLERATRGDQIENARYYSSRGAVKTLRESELTPASLFAAAVAALNNAAMSRAGALLPPINGADKICELIRKALLRDN